MCTLVQPLFHVSNWMFYCYLQILIILVIAFSSVKQFNSGVWLKSLNIHVGLCEYMKNKAISIDKPYMHTHIYWGQTFSLVRDIAKIFYTTSIPVSG